MRSAIVEQRAQKSVRACRYRAALALAPAHNADPAFFAAQPTQPSLAGSWLSPHPTILARSPCLTIF